MAGRHLLDHSSIYYFIVPSYGHNTSTSRERDDTPSSIQRAFWRDDVLRSGGLADPDERKRRSTQMSHLLENYLGSLPQGWDSYASCKQKASIYLGFLAEVPAIGRSRRRLPEPLRDLIENRRNPSGWIPEVHGIALWLATCDLFFESVDTVLFEHIYRLNKALMANALYRIMFMVMSPQILLVGGSARWAAFHLGSNFETTLLSKDSGVLRLTYPSKLFPELAARAYQSVYEAALEAGGIRRASVCLRSWTPSSATFDATWT